MKALIGLVLPVLGAGLLLAVLLVAVLEWLSRSRRAGQPSAVGRAAPPGGRRGSDDTVVLPAVTAGVPEQNSRHR
jgi:hypothetical protein